MNLVNTQDRVVSGPFSIIFGILVLPFSGWYIYIVSKTVRTSNLFLSNENFIIGTLLIVSAIYLVFIGLNLLTGKRRKSGYLLHPFVHIFISSILIVLPIIAICYKILEGSGFEMAFIASVSMSLVIIPASIQNVKKFLTIYKNERHET